MDTNAQQEGSIKATIIRANGTIEDLGVIVGGNIWQKVNSFLRIKVANFKQKWRQF